MKKICRGDVTDLKQLKYFLTIAEEGQITSAAKRLHIAQPPLSQQLKNLENELGIELIKRGSRHIELSDAGKILRDRASQILNLSDSTVNEILDLKKGFSGTLKIGTVSSSGTILLNSRMNEFVLKYPDVKFELYDSSKVDEVLLTKRFKAYFQEKAKLLDKIINSHLANYTLLQTQYSAAYNQFTLKNEELLAYQKAVNDAKNKITDLNDKIEELRNKVVYKIRLTSSMGDIFTNGQIKTRLSVEFLKNDVDYTDNLRDQDIIWIKMNEDGQPDEEWNSAHVGAGKYIDITEEDVTNKAIFEVRVYELIE